MVAEKALEAAKLGDIELLESLNLSRCLDEKVTDSVGATCIHYAARAGNLDVLDYLVTDCGFRGNKRTKIGATAAHDAAATGNLDCLTFMLDFLKTGCQVDDTDSTGATILHLASRFGHYIVVRWILENTEVNATRKTVVGALPIHFAAARGDIRIVQLLVRQAPSTINMQMGNGVTAAYLACQEGHLEVLKFLVLAAGASLKIPAHDGMTCIHSAAQSGHLSVVSYLVTNQNSDPNERDFEGTTPIHFASSRGHTKVLSWLLLHGGKILLDNLGGSPLHDASEHGQLESITVLLEHGCDATIADNNGITAEELAEHCLHRECAILIKQFRPSQPNGHSHDVEEPRNYNTNQSNGKPNGHSHDVEEPRNYNTNQSNGKPNGHSHDVEEPRNYNTNQSNGNGHINGSGHINGNGRMDFDDDFRSQPVSRKSNADRRIPDYEPGSCTPTTVVVEVEVHRTNSGLAPAKRQCLSAETGETVTCPQVSQPTRPVSYPSSTMMSDTHSNLSSTTSTMTSTVSMLSYSDRLEHDSMQRSHSDHHHRNSNAVYHDENRGPQSAPQHIQQTQSHQGNRSVLARFPQNQENGESGYGTHWSNEGNQMPLNEMSPSNGHDRSVSPNPRNQIPIHEMPPSNGMSNIHQSYGGNSPSPSPQPSSTFQDQIRQQSLKVQSKSYAEGLDAVDNAHVPPPPPPMPPPPPPNQAPPAPPLPAVGMVKENVAKAKPYQFSNTRQSQPNKLNNSMQTSLTPRPNSLQKDKAKTDNIIAELKSVNMVASLRKVRKDSGTVVFDSSKNKTPISPTQSPSSPVIAANVTPDMPLESFLAEIPDRDQRGNEVPTWRRQLLARQLMEKTKKDHDQKQKVEEEEDRLKNMPQWKRDMLQRKKAEQGDNESVTPEGEETRDSKSVPATPTVDEEGKPIPPWKQEFMQRRK